MVKASRADNEKAFWQQGLSRIEKDAEGYHLNFAQHSENFQSYCHLAFPEGIE